MSWFCGIKGIILGMYVTIIICWILWLSLKVLLCSANSSFPLTDNPVFHWFLSFAFPRVSCSWNRTACSHWPCFSDAFKFSLLHSLVPYFLLVLSSISLFALAGLLTFVVKGKFSFSFFFLNSNCLFAFLSAMTKRFSVTHIYQHWVLSMFYFSHLNRHVGSPHCFSFQILGGLCWTFFEQLFAVSISLVRYLLLPILKISLLNFSLNFKMFLYALDIR